VIVVSPGLALDMDGREIILVEEREVPIMGKPDKAGKGVEGNYLYIQYYEETRAEESENCTPRSSPGSSTGRGNGRKGKEKLAWGGPSRVRATPVLGWSTDFPHESSGKVALAQVEFDAQCQVQNIYNYPRRYIGPASNAMVRQYALEGERHIDKDNPGRIYFHIRGRQPTAVTLYLRAEKFSTLYYTEMGEHNHSIHINVNSLSIPAHDHDMPKSESEAGTPHTHNVSSVTADADTSIWAGALGAVDAAAVAAGLVVLSG